MHSRHSTERSAESTTVKYDLFGAAYLQIEGDRRRTNDPSRWLNSFRSEFDHCPDIRVEFTRIEIPKARLSLSREASVSQDGRDLYWVDRRGERAHFHLDGRKQPFVQIKIDPESPAVPFLKPFIELAGLKRGAVSVHASGFALEGQGIMIAGLPLSGKTSLSLSVVKEGAEFLGDDWMLLKTAQETPVVCGIPRRLELTGRMLEHLGPRDLGLSAKDRLKVRADKLLEGFPILTDKSSAFSALTRFLRQRLRVSVDPQWTAQPEAPRPLRELFITFRGDFTEISTRSIPSEAAVEQLIALANLERQSLMRALSLWGVFLPEIGPMMRELLEKQRQELTKLLRNTRCHILLHHPNESYAALAEQILKQISTAGDHD